MRALAAALVLAACGPSVHPGGDDGASAPDAGAPDAPTDDGGQLAAVYAHTASTLYRVDPDTFSVTPIGAFQWPASVGSDSMTDLAIDKDGLMIGISYTRVYQVDPASAATTLLSDHLSGMFNGLSFVDGAQVGVPDGPDVLVGDRNSDGKIFSIDPHTGAATAIGDMGGDWVSSGDLVSVHGFGTVATVTTSGSLGADVLVRLDPVTFHATPIGDGTGAADLWGVGFWKGKVFGFSDGGAFVLIDTTTGSSSPVSSSSEAWWGAAVTTAAPVVSWRSR